MVSETSVELHLKHVVEQELGGLCIKLFPFAMRFLSDRLVLLPGGRLWFIEVKQLTGRLAKGQARMHDRLRKLGFQVECLWSREQVDAWAEVMK